MDRYLPTGNDFVSLPRINERTGGIEDITFLYMAAKGLIDIRGSESTPLIQPYVQQMRCSGEKNIRMSLNWLQKN